MTLNDTSGARDIAEHFYGAHILTGERPYRQDFKHGTLARIHGPRRSRWVFILPIVALGCLAAAAIADPNTAVWKGSAISNGHDAWLSLDEPYDPAAFASLTFHNEAIHVGDELLSLTFDGVTIDIQFEMNVDRAADRITPLLPAGFYAKPAEIIVPESDTGILHIYKFRGM